MAAFSTYFFAGISKEGLSIPDVKANIDTLGKQKVNCKTFYICPKVSLE